MAWVGDSTSARNLSGGNSLSKMGESPVLVVFSLFSQSRREDSHNMEEQFSLPQNSVYAEKSPLCERVPLRKCPHDHSMLRLRRRFFIVGKREEISRGN